MWKKALFLLSFILIPCLAFGAGMRMDNLVVGGVTDYSSGASLFVKGTGNDSGTTPAAIVNSNGQTDWMVSGDGTESIRSGNTFFLDRTNSYGIWTGSDGKAYIKDVSGEREL